MRKSDPLVSCFSDGFLALAEMVCDATFALDDLSSSCSSLFQAHHHIHLSHAATTARLLGIYTLAMVDSREEEVRRR